MTTAMPARLLTPEGDAWLLRAKLLYDAFHERADGNYFARKADIEDAYAQLSPTDFCAQYGEPF